MKKIWGLVGQMLSSATNLVGSIVAAATLDIAAFGYYFVLQTAFLLALGMSRGAVGEILLFSSMFSNDEPESGFMADALRFYLMLGVPFGVIGGLVVWLFLPVQPAALAIIFATLVPAVLVQDYGRYAAFSAGRHDVSAFSDAIWLALLGIFLFFAGQNASLATVFGSWALSGAIAGVVVLLKFRFGLEAGSARRWFRTQRAHSLRMAAEYMLAPLCRWGLVVFVTVVVGAETVGLFREAEVLFGPFVVLSLAAHVTFGPLLSEGAGTHRRYIRRASGAFAAILLGWWAGLRLGLLDVYNGLVADPATDAVSLLIVTVLSFVVFGRSWQGTYVTVLRSAGNTSASLRVGAVSAFSGSVLGAVLAMWQGPVGIAVGLGIGYVLGAVVGHIEIRKGQFSSSSLGTSAVGRRRKEFA